MRTKATQRRVFVALCAVGLLAAGFVAGALVFRPKGAPAKQAAGGRRILYYRSPMNPQITSPTPKKDPMGMDFTPVHADEAGAGGAGAPGQPPPGAGPNAIRIDPRVTQEVGVTTEKAEVRQLSRAIRTVGMVRPDERRLHSITVKFPGWVDRLYVNFTGDHVERGAPLADIYSPELLATQQEFLLAVRYAKSFGAGTTPATRVQANDLLESARRRLLLWDISEQQIDELARRGQPTRLMTLHAPADGVVMEKEITAGSQVQPGMMLMRIADLRDIWVFAQIYPYQLSWIRVGQPAQIQVPGIPGQTLEGRVNYIQPVVQPEARTVEVRIQVPQPGGGIILKPNMYSNVEIRSPLEVKAIAIREQAVIRSGERNIAVIALGNGYYEPRDIKLGVTAEGYVEVLDGIKPGEEVVTSSQFLLDSESNLRAAMGAMGGGHAGMSMGGSGASKPEQGPKQEQEHKDHGGMPMEKGFPPSQRPGGGADVGTLHGEGHDVR